MTKHDEAKTLARRGETLAGDLQRLGQDAPVGAPSVLARTRVSTSYPSTARSFHSCVPVTLLGTEVEGGPGVFAESASSFLALNLGSKVPPPGTYILATFVADRWVFRHDV
ncbi:MAG: hypothetical protein AB7I30_01510 [Isosphaeraceae bacterium]